MDVFHEPDREHERPREELVKDWLALLSAAMVCSSVVITAALYTGWGAYGWRFWVSTAFIFAWIIGAAALAKAGGVGAHG